MNKEQLDKALEFAKMFGKEYKQLENDLLVCGQNVRLMRDKLNMINKCLRGNIDFDE